MAVETYPKLRRKQVLAFALETTTGTAAALSGTNGVTNIFNPQVSYSTEIVERQSQGNFSPIVQGLGARSAKLTFETELVGSGSSGSTPSWHNLLLACGISYSAGVYTPVTSGTYNTLTMGHYVDGRLFKMIGCQGTAVFKIKRGQKVNIAWTFSGVQDATSDASILALSSTVGSEAWNSRDLKSRPH